MASGPDVTVDHAVCREEPLRLNRRLGPLYLPLSPSRGPMRILGTIIQIAARSVPDIGHHLAMRNTVAAQPVGNAAPRLVLQPVQKPPEEAFRRCRISAILHEDVEHDPVLVHSSPEIVQRAVHSDEYLVEVPNVAGLRSPLPEPFRVSNQTDHRRDYSLLPLLWYLMEECELIDLFYHFGIAKLTCVPWWKPTSAAGNG